MTTATHSLDTSSGTTTVAELLARNGATGNRPSHRRSAPEPAERGSLNGTLPAFDRVSDGDHLDGDERGARPVGEPADPKQYRYDQTTVTALLTAAPAEPKSGAAATRSKHTGRKIAGLAFAGAVLASGWALASGQAQPGDRPASASPVPAKAPDAPLAVANAATLQAIGAQSAALALAPASPATTQVPAPAERAPDRGSFSGTLPNTTKAKPPVSTARPAPNPQPAQPAPNWRSYFAKYADAKNPHGNGRHNHGDGGKHGKGH